MNASMEYTFLYYFISSNRHKYESMKSHKSQIKAVEITKGPSYSIAKDVLDFFDSQVKKISLFLVKNFFTQNSSLNLDLN